MMKCFPTTVNYYLMRISHSAIVIKAINNLTNKMLIASEDNKPLLIKAKILIRTVVVEDKKLNLITSSIPPFIVPLIAVGLWWCPKLESSLKIRAIYLPMIPCFSKLWEDSQMKTSKAICLLSKILLTLSITNSTCPSLASILIVSKQKQISLGILQTNFGMMILPSLANR